MNWIEQEIRKVQDLDSDEKIYCPFCEEQKAKVIGDKWKCSCGKHGKAEELLRLVQEEYLAKHKASFWNSKNNKGVGY